MGPVTFTSPAECSVLDGYWIGLFTNTPVETASSLDVDHMVPLKNAHDSGGWAWDAARKEAYANDLSDPDHLIAVTASANRSKGASGPENWKPPNTDYWCDYAVNWIRIKNTWALTVTGAEWEALAEMLRTCGGGSPVVVLAAPAPPAASPAPTVSASPSPTPSPSPSPTASPTASPTPTPALLRRLRPRRTQHQPLRAATRPTPTPPRGRATANAFPSALLTTTARAARGTAPTMSAGPFGFCRPTHIGSTRTRTASAASEDLRLTSIIPREGSDPANTDAESLGNWRRREGRLIVQPLSSHQSPSHSSTITRAAVRCRRASLAGSDPGAIAHGAPRRRARRGGPCDSRVESRRSS